MAGDHELGQMGLQMRLERVFQLAAVLSHQIGRQLLAARAIDIDHAGFADCRVFQQARFDFTQLDPQAANLHLMVDTAGVLDHALVAVTRQVAGAVEAAALGGERIRHKAFGGQRRTVVVTAGQTDAAQIQLGGGARCSGQQAVFEDVGFQVVDRLTNWNAQVIVDGAGPVSDVDRRLGRTVQVVQPAVWQAFQHLGGQLGRQCFTAANDALEAGTAFNVLAGHECLKHRRHEVQRADAVLVDGRHQTLRIAVIARQRYRQTGTGQQRPEELPHRHVEAERGLLQHGIRAVQTVGLLHPVQTVDQGAMAVAGAFRFTSGARGIDHVGEVFRHAVQRRVGVAVTVQIQLIQAKRLDTRWNRQTINQCLLGQQQLHTTVLDHVRQTVLWIIGVQRHISTAGLDDRHQANHHFQAALDRNAHQRIRANAQLAQFVSELVGAAVDLGVAQFFTREDQRRSVRRRGNLRLDQALNARLAWELGGGSVPVAEDVLLLDRGQHRQLTQRRLRIGHQRQQQVLEMRRQLRDGIAGQLLTVVAHAHGQLVARLDHQGQRIVGLLLADHLVEHQCIRRRAMQRIGDRVVLEDHDRVEQRFAIPARPALDVIQRRVLVFAQGQVLRLDLLHPLGHGLLDPRTAHHRQGVDEQAKLFFDTRQVGRTPGDGGAEGHARLPGVALQHQHPGRLQQGVGGDALVAGEVVEATSACAVQGQQQVGEALAFHRCLEHRHQAGRLVQLGQLAQPEVLADLGVLALQPFDVVAVALARRRHMTAVALQHLAEHARVAPAVEQDVVAGEHQVVAVLGGTQQGQAQQRIALQIEAALFVRLGPGRQGLVR